MRNLLKLNHLLLLAVTIIIMSCDSNDPEPGALPVASDGFFIVNEGGFDNGNTSLSFFSRSEGTVTNDVFFNANEQKPLGDQAQSMSIHDTLGYIVVQNSAKIEVIGVNSYKSVATIATDLPSPRYFVGYADSKGFVSDWGVGGVEGTVKVIDLTTFSVTKTIETGQGSNKMALFNDQLYVTHSGGFGRDNQVTVIDANTEEIVNTIELGDNPNSIQADVEGNIWVLTSGHTAFNEDWSVDVGNSTNAQLFKISETGDQLAAFTMPSLGGAVHLSISPDGEKLYYLYGGAIYTLGYQATELPAEPMVSKSYYGLAIDPVDGSIIGCEAPDFESAGNIDIYNVSGLLTSSHEVGIAPNSCTFK